MFLVLVVDVGFGVFDLLEGIKCVCPMCRFGFGVVM